jgi:hypothetical protein
MRSALRAAVTVAACGVLGAELCDLRASCFVAACADAMMKKLNITQQKDELTKVNKKRQ